MVGCLKRFVLEVWLDEEEEQDGSNVKNTIILDLIKSQSEHDKNRELFV